MLFRSVEILFPGRGGVVGRFAGAGLAGLLTSVGALVVWIAILVAVGLLIAETQVRRLFSLLFGTAARGASAVATGVGGIAAAREAKRDRQIAAAEAERTAVDEGTSSGQERGHRGDLDD